MILVPPGLEYANNIFQASERVRIKNRHEVGLKNLHSKSPGRAFGQSTACLLQTRNEILLKSLYLAANYLPLLLGRFQLFVGQLLIFDGCAYFPTTPKSLWDKGFPGVSWPRKAGNPGDIVSSGGYPGF